MRPTAASVVLAIAAAVGGGGVAAAERAIEKSVVVEAPLAQAWAAWTTRDGIISFFAPDAVVDARPGGAFHIHFDPNAPAGARGADDMRYLALQPMRMLSFDWNAPPHLAQARAQRTFVVVRFTAVDGGRTRVTLHHMGWGDGGEWDQTYSCFDRAWDNVLASMKTRFDSGPVDWRPWLQQLDAMRARQRAAAASATKP